MRYELGGREWYSALHAIIAGVLAEVAQSRPQRAAGLSYSMCEVCTDPPAHLATDGGRVGWHCVVEAGALVRFAPTEADVQYKVMADYQVMLQLSRFRTDGVPERWKRYSEQSATLFKEGKLTIIGEQPRFPREFARIHDVMARLTA